MRGNVKVEAFMGTEAMIGIGKDYLRASVSHFI